MLCKCRVVPMAARESWLAAFLQLADGEKSEDLKLLLRICDNILDHPLVRSSSSLF